MHSYVTQRLQGHLDRVSRSFAACIAELEQPLRHWVGLAYALCRAVDTIEDAPWPTPHARTHSLEQFCALLGQPPVGAHKAAMAVWCRSLPAELEAGERALIADTPWLLGELHELPQGARKAIVETVVRMAAGMGHYARRWHHNGALRLYDGIDVNRYCYFVAGVVGELLCRLFVLSEPGFCVAPSHLVDAHHFGLFLQKVNLLKDQRVDEIAARYLVPERSQVMASLERHARRALAYILALPHHAAPYRTFCAFSLLLGASSLPVIAQAHRGGTTTHAAKIPRDKTEALFATIRRIASDDAALEEHFELAWTALAPHLQHEALTPPVLTQPSHEDWFAALVAPGLSAQQQQHLGLVYAL